MNKAEAKREAFRRAASCLDTAMESGWLTWDPGTGENPYETPADAKRVSDALTRLIAELHRRGGSA